MSEEEMIADIREMTRLAKAIGDQRDDWRARCEKAEGERDAAVTSLAIVRDQAEANEKELIAERDGLAGRVGEVEGLLRRVLERNKPLDPKSHTLAGTLPQHTPGVTSGGITFTTGEDPLMGEIRGALGAG